MAMYLYYDLYSVEGELLVKANEKITSALIKMVRVKGDKRPQPRTLLKDTETFKDFENILADPRYITMFADLGGGHKQISDIAGELDLENDVVAELKNLKAGNPYTHNHVLVVSAFAIRLSQAYKKETYEERKVSHCGFTHDIGKLRVPVALLDKPGRLEEEEKMIMQTHPLIGYILLNYYLNKERLSSSLSNLRHHERLDGSGYPKGIRRIDKYTQLISAVDVLDALTSKRPYREKVFSLRAALDYLLKQAHEHKFDKDLILTLISLARKDKPDIRTIKVSSKPREELPGELS